MSAGVVPFRASRPVGPRPPRCAQHRTATVTRGSYSRGCEVCRVRAAWYFRYRAALIRDGRWEPDVPVAKVSGYVSDLYEAGMSDRQIGDRAGLCPDTVGRIRREKYPTVTAVTAAALFGVELLPASERLGMVDVTGTRRRLQALGRAAHPTTVVAVAIGSAHKTLTAWTGKQCRAAVCSQAAGVTAYYEAHVRQVGPGTIASVSRARNAGWLPWYAWREDEIDDPAVDPFAKLPSTVARRKLRALAAMAWGPEHIAAEYDDLDPARLDRIMRDQGSHVWVYRWELSAIGHALDAYGDVPGPAYALAVEAREDRWQTAAAWDGRDIDDPQDRGRAQPDPDQPAPAYSEAGIALALSGHTVRADLNDVEATFVVATLRQRGLNDHEIALHLRWPGKDPHGAVARLMCDDRRPVLPPELAARLTGWVDDRAPRVSGHKGRRPGATNLANREGAAA